VLEQVRGFLQTQPGQVLSEYQLLAQRIRQIPLDPDAEDPLENGGPLYTAIRAFTIDSTVWLQVSRPRVYTVMMTEEAGGQAGLEEVTAMIGEVYDYRARFAPIDPQALFTGSSEEADEEHSMPGEAVLLPLTARDRVGFLPRTSRFSRGISNPVDFQSFSA
jgi:hypothetical protein